MKFRNFLSLTAIIVTVIITSNIAYAGGPILFLKQIGHDFGTVEQHKELKHKFAYENTGTEDLEILDVKPGCGCTAALLKSRTVKPGEKGELEVTFNSGKFKGKVTKKVYIETNEPRGNSVLSMPIDPSGDKKVGKKDGKVHQVYIKAVVIYDKKKQRVLEEARKAAQKRRELEMQRSKEKNK
ncbi:DUF1573 domain-containing protein [Thermodesulfobacteriota bacterium]